MNIKKTNLKQRLIIFVYVIFFSYHCVEEYLNYAGRNFPTENQLQYSTGILNSHDVSSREHLFLTDNDTQKQTEFSCSYTAYNKLNLSSCYSPLKFSSFNGQKATIGYYYQSDSLWFHNPVPQVVTVRVGEKKILTYEQTIEKINNRNSPYLFIGFSIFIILMGVLWYFILGIPNSRPK